MEASERCVLAGRLIDEACSWYVGAEEILYQGEPHKAIAYIKLGVLYTTKVLNILNDNEHSSDCRCEQCLDYRYREELIDEMIRTGKTEEEIIADKVEELDNTLHSWLLTLQPEDVSHVAHKLTRPPHTKPDVVERYIKPANEDAITSLSKIKYWLDSAMRLTQEGQIYLALQSLQSMKDRTEEAYKCLNEERRAKERSD